MPFRNYANSVFVASSRPLKSSLFLRVIQRPTLKAVRSFNSNKIMSTLPPLSALAKFDDLMRCSKELTAGVAEESELKWKFRVS